MPVQPDTPYPYTKDGIWPGQPTGECFDAIATLAFIAGCTQRIKLLTSVIVVPHRPAVLTAKLLLTADVLSGGRVVAGVGAGWMREEFAALGTPPFDERGAVTDEYLEAWKRLWTQDRPALDGKYANFRDVVFMPKPVSQPHPPIWVGGESPAALRRTVQFGDAWYPVSNNQKIPLEHAGRGCTPASPRCTARRKRRDAIRRRSTSAMSGSCRRPGHARPGPDGDRQMFSGSADDMLADAAALREAGARHVIVYLQRPTIEQTLDVQQRFAEDVVRKVT